ncbi:type II toxin-antitoxin system ParD family antitoxin [Magnetospirillum sp. UT-4]|uniref:type II toxin-antitoxin system ParD family antitoxin n=1 Tax=Magnetospirillum sp. UT-4 TaxID=2681467 RepID=UPI00138063E5|nr:type II toxin-antitoxin system ParD family antitoxin [Magnetospirillum sp. UT-4]CAA7621427.1 conserved hypothetical protein [Magnetospirillum sp. UT-4]
MATNVHLTPDLEAFARACVEGGRYNNVSEVVRAGLRLLQDADEQRRRFNAMLDAVRDEAVRDGSHDLADVLAAMDGAMGGTAE